MKDIEDKLQKIFSRAIARALGAMEIEKTSDELKSAVKSAFWDTMTYVMGEIEKNEKKQS